MFITYFTNICYNKTINTPNKNIIIIIDEDINEYLIDIVNSLLLIKVIIVSEDIKQQNEPLSLLYKFIDSYKNIIQKTMNGNKINILLILNKLMNL